MGGARRRGHVASSRAAPPSPGVLFVCTICSSGTGGALSFALAMATLTDLLGEVGVTLPAIQALSRVFDGTVRDFAYLSAREFDHLVGDLRVTPPPSAGAAADELASAGEVPISLKDTVRLRQARDRARAVTHYLSGAAPSGEITKVTSLPSQPSNKRIKLSSLVDPAAETDLEPLPESVLRDLFAEFHQKRGGPPGDEVEPTNEQISAIKQLVDSNSPPYVDFALFGPRGRHFLEKLTYIETVFHASSGTWVRHELPGPSNYEAWERSWGVFECASILLKIISPENLSRYHERIKKLASLYGLAAWPVVYQADVKMRSEHIERLLRRAEIREDPLLLREAPWDYAFHLASGDDRFWFEEVQEKATLLLAKATPIGRLLGEATLSEGATSYSTKSDVRNLTETDLRARLQGRKEVKQRRGGGPGKRAPEPARRGLLPASDGAEQWGAPDGGEAYQGPGPHDGPRACPGRERGRLPLTEGEEDGQQSPSSAVGQEIIVVSDAEEPLDPSVALRRPPGRRAIDGDERDARQPIRNTPIVAIIELCESHLGALLREVFTRIDWRLRLRGASVQDARFSGPPLSSDEWWISTLDELRLEPAHAVIIVVPTKLHATPSGRNSFTKLRSVEAPSGVSKGAATIEETQLITEENYVLFKAARMAAEAARQGSVVNLISEATFAGAGPFVHPECAELANHDFHVGHSIVGEDRAVYWCTTPAGHRFRAESTPARVALDVAGHATDACHRGPLRATSEGDATMPADANPWGATAPLVRDAPLRGEAAPSAREVRDKENAAAVGGMRNPAQAVSKLPQVQALGRRLREALLPLVAPGQPIPRITGHLLSGGVAEPPPAGVCDAPRRAIAEALGIAAPTAPGLDHATLYAIRDAGDPDPHVADWVKDGAPLGISRPVPSSGIFPPVPGAAPTSTLSDIVTDFDAFVNYSSAEESPEVCLDLLRKMTSRGWAVELPDLRAAHKFLGTHSLTFNRLALITKERPDGSLKHRLVWDLRRSGVNQFISPGERVVLPRLGDVIADAHSLWGADPNAPEAALLGADVSDAFHLVPLEASEWKYTLASVVDRLFVFKVLVFGSASAPTVWGRVAALCGRVLAAVLQCDHARVQMYVDDPLVSLRGATDDLLREGSLFLATLVALGLPLSWAKAAGGRTLGWIGAQLTVAPDHISVSVPADKCLVIVQDLNALLGAKRYPVYKLSNLAGRIAFFAGLLPVLRPFLDQYWAEIAAHRPGGNRSGGAKNKSKGYFATSSVRRSTLWFRAFFTRQETGIERKVRLGPPTGPIITVVVDASPWGVGGVEYVDGRPDRWFGEPIGDDDVQILSSPRGVSDSTTTFEALALVVAFKYFIDTLSGARIRVRSDSLSTLLSAQAGRGRAPALNRCMAELALLRAEHELVITELRHIPGVSNDVADALSRRWAPRPRAVPGHLAMDREVPLVPRDRAWWRTLA